MLKYLVVCLVAVCAVHAVHAVPTKWMKPKYCRGLDCPEFTLLNKTKDYEIRRYAASNWVATNITGTDYGTTGSIMFRKLFNYIDGMNANNQKIPMTAPVLRMIIPGQGPTCASTFMQHFFLSSDVVASAPAPRDPSVYLISYPEITMYVGTFGGFARTEAKWIDASVALAAAIGDSSLYKTSHWFTAGYDSPFTFLNRHNEVMFEKIEQ